jgi:arylsulfatase A-like enzyme
MAASPSSTNRPNVVLVVCDQMRAQAMSCAGDPNVETPNLDRLAEEGVRFTNANASCPICVPSRLALQTGHYPHTRNAYHGWRMSPAERTFAHELGAAGYATGHVGKWHLSNTSTPRLTMDHLQGGYDYWRSFEVSNEPFETTYVTEDDPTPRPVEGFQTDGLFDLGEAFLDDLAGGSDPFCLVLSVEPPHPPFSAPEEYLDRWADRSLELRPNVPYGEEPLPEKHAPPDGIDTYDSWGDRDAATPDLYARHEYHGDVVLDEMRGYYAMIENLDDNIGRLVADLEERGIRDETVLVFTSDHGEMLGSQGLMMKQQPYDESVGVPLIVSHPGGPVAEGLTVDEPVTLEDWFPTVCTLAGVEPSAGVPGDERPGEDLTPLLTGEADSLDRPGVLLEFVHEARPAMAYSEDTWRAFRTERYKYTVLEDGERGQPWQLFDLVEDPYEQHNLLEDPAFADVAAEMHGHLRDALVDLGDDYALDPAFGHDARF